MTRRPVVLAALVALTRLPGLVGGLAFNPDEATLATGGRAVLDGRGLYVGVIDRKPPLPFAAYGGVFGLSGTGDLRLVRLLVAVLVLVSALVLASEAGRRWGDRAAWVAGLVVVLGAAALGARDAQAANFELFALLPIAVAVVAAGRGRALVAGAALAVAVLCKQPAAVTVVPVAWALWRCGRWRSLSVGAAAGAVTALAVAAPFGVRDVVEWALLGTGGYVGLDPSGVGTAAGRLAALVGLALVFWGGAWLLVVAPARGRDGDDAPPARDPADTELWLLLGVSALGVVPGFRFFPHYLVQLLPAVALLAARGVARWPALARPALAWGVASSLLAAGLAWGTVAAGPPAYERRLAGYVERHSEPGDGLLVWGNVPELYWRSDRPPAGGFTHTEFVTGYSGGRRHQYASEAKVPDRQLYVDFVARLEADPPVLVLDTSPADIRGGKWFPIRRFPAVQDLLRERYERVATIDEVAVYRLTDRSEPR
jgi:hypothetical protein